jgi:NADH:ubiquinone oxidoreductase subunit E
MNTTAVPAKTAQPSRQGEITSMAKRWKEKRGGLILALNDSQNHHAYIPRDAAMALGIELGVPLARIYEVPTFYNYFRLKSPGKHMVSVCMGTACYLRGGAKLVDATGSLLGIKPGETSQDGNFHLEMVRCLGCCGLAPVVTINGEISAKMNETSLREQLTLRVGKGGN